MHTTPEILLVLWRLIWSILPLSIASWFHFADFFALKENVTLNDDLKTLYLL